jgi:hypothetical protein
MTDVLNLFGGGDDLCSIRLFLEPNFVDVNDG